MPFLSQIVLGTPVRPSECTSAARRSWVTSGSASPRRQAAASASSATAWECPVNHGDLRSAKSPSASRAESKASPVSRARGGSAATTADQHSSSSPRRMSGTAGASAETRLGSRVAPAWRLISASAASTPRSRCSVSSLQDIPSVRAASVMSSPAIPRGMPLPSHRANFCCSGLAHRLAEAESLREAACDPAIRDVYLHHGVHAAEQRARRRSALAATDRRASRRARGGSGASRSGDGPTS